LARPALGSYPKEVLRWIRPLGRAAFPSALVLGTLAALMPRLGSADSDAAPEVDLSRMSLTDSGAQAPLADGRSAELTLEASLQRSAQRLLAAAHPVEGAVSLIDAKTGRLLVFAEYTRSSSYGHVLTRSVQPAASVFKLVTTAALLEGGEVSPVTKVCTAGGMHRIERRHLDAPRTGRALCAPFAVALGHSRNAVYAQLATHHLARQELIDMGERLGLNHPVPFDVPALTGTLRVPYNDLAFARTAAGFQGSTLSPLGAAELAYSVAAGGQIMRLRIVAKAPGFTAPDQSEATSRVFGSRTAERMRRMMEVTVREGTSAEAFTDPAGHPYLGGMRVAGKTGTLQPDPKKPTASWFTGFAPSRRPLVVVSVLLVNGKVWRRKANEIARDMLRVYFHSRGRNGITSPFEDPEPEAHDSALTESER
jgi:peptidoglycan glycosyltransferase